MNAAIARTETESRSGTYLRAAAFSLPALIIWTFSCVFLFPKLQQLWAEAGFQASPALAAADAARFVFSHGLLLSAGVLLTLILLEWRSSIWPRYRRAFVGVAAFLVNTSVLLFMTGMLVSALLAAPALLRMQ